MAKEVKDEFQTPMEVANYMASLIPEPEAEKTARILEPTPGQGNIVKCVKRKLYAACDVTEPENFFEFEFNKDRPFDCIIMNPPFSEKSAFGIPEDLDLKGMRLGYYILKKCMENCDNVIALMPWFTLLDSDVRMRELEAFGIVSLTSLPRKTFQYARIQTVVIELQRGHKGATTFKNFRF